MKTYSATNNYGKVPNKKSRNEGPIVIIILLAIIIIPTLIVIHSDKLDWFWDHWFLGDTCGPDYDDGDDEIHFFVLYHPVGFYNNAIEIDDGNVSVTTNDWNSTKLKGWCNGSGTIDDPYIISYLRINGQNSVACITIKNSNAYFIVKNNKFHNKGAPTIIGIRLVNVSNGILQDNYYSDQLDYGIYLKNCNNVIIRESLHGGIIIENCVNITIF